MVKRFPELDDNAQRGSKPRCHLLTDGTRADVAGTLTELSKPHGSVLKTFNWEPNGFDSVEEVQLHDPNGLISTEASRNLKDWWFDTPGGSSPSWDLVSQCAFGIGDRARSGILLVEAKAHTGELKNEGKKLEVNVSVGSRRNHERIGQAIEEANVGLRRLTGNQGWAISRDECYQMANRIAWAWKLASMGIPVVLVYLGFLNAIETSDLGDSFREPLDWVECVKTHCKGKVPEDVWDRYWTMTNGALFELRIVSVHQSLVSVRGSH